MHGPPVIVSDVTDNGGPLSLCVPRKNADGTLSIPPLISVFTERCYLTPRHSGDGNVVVTRGSKTHVVWLTAGTIEANSDGGPCYAATYDRATGTVSKPQLIGFSVQKNNHNGPVITVDSKGILHVVIGSHHKRFRYTRSLAPNSTEQGWSDPVPFGVDAKGGGYTYTALLCDRDDTLHLVSRYAGDGYYFRLNDQRKKAGKPWEDNKYLVNPFRPYYSVWRHKLTIDGRGRLFLYYIYYANQLDRDKSESGEVAAYRKRWPEDELTGPRAATWWGGLKAHDPCILLSDDKGDSWRLAVTADFVAGIEQKKATNAKPE